LNSASPIKIDNARTAVLNLRLIQLEMGCNLPQSFKIEFEIKHSRLGRSIISINMNKKISPLSGLASSQYDFEIPEKNLSFLFIFCALYLNKNVAKSDCCWLVGQQPLIKTLYDE
jgi:hypothetical protein